MPPPVPGAPGYGARRPHAAPAGPAAPAPVRPRAGHRVQPAGPLRRRRRDGRRPGAEQGRRRGASTCSTTTTAAASCTCTSACTARSRGRRVPDAAAGRAGPDADGRHRVRHRPARPDGLRGDRRGARSTTSSPGSGPTRCAATPTRTWRGRESAKSRRPIGALLMDQTVIAGVGNVYRSELLFRHRIDPYRPGRDISADEFDATWTDLVALMKVGVRRGKIIMVRPEHDHGAPSYAPRPSAHLRLPPRRRAVPGVRHDRCAPPNSKAATCSGARPARCERSRFLAHAFFVRR